MTSGLETERAYSGFSYLLTEDTTYRHLQPRTYTGPGMVGLTQTSNTATSSTRANKTVHTMTTTLKSTRTTAGTKRPNHFSTIPHSGTVKQAEMVQMFQERTRMIPRKMHGLQNGECKSQR